MATNTHTPDFQDTMPAACRPTTARPPRSPAADADDLVTLISPERVVVVIGLLTMVVLLLASIAGVAQAQVRKGHDFQFAQSPAAPQAATVYSSQGGARVYELGPVAALSN